MSAAPFKMSVLSVLLLGVALLQSTLTSAPAQAAAPTGFLKSHCYDCHSAAEPAGGLDLSALGWDLSNAENFARWVKIFDRVQQGEMPPPEAERPPAAERERFTQALQQSLLAAEQARFTAQGRTGIRRLTRSEYENTIRDLFAMPGIALAGGLPADGSAHGFDKNSDALDISHVNMARYVEAAEHVLEYATATQPTAPTVQKRRISLMNRGGSVAHVVMNGDGVLLRDKQPDPDFPASGEHRHIDQGAHQRMGAFETGSTVGLFRHEDESFSCYFIEHTTIYPGLYRVRTSLWSFQWDKGKVLPSRGVEAARLSVVQLTGDGRGGQHPSYVLGYYDAPSLESQEHELVQWLNINELIGFNTGSLAPVANYARKGRAMAFTGPGIACDWLDVEGPLHDVWPPVAHQVLFGDLPLVEFQPAEHPGVRPPERIKVRHLGGLNRPDPPAGLWTVGSDQPLVDADRLLARFLPRAFRRPVAAEVRQQYVALAAQRMEAGDCFETAMRWAYRAALCSPDFLYHVEPEGPLDDYALANRLSYYLWNSMPDERLTDLAAAGKLRQPDVLQGEVERLLRDPKSERFVKDFLGQWLNLQKIAANDPDRKLYPEFGPYLQDSMVAETEAYFRELLEKDLDASHLIRSDFAMLNEKLATHYGIEGVSGSQIRRVPLPADCPRGGFLTQASILKISANGTTTSPVPRGAFVLERLLGQAPDPPPPNIPAIEPDVRGATTIREQLDKHRNNTVCASCHAKIDPPGFALEAFDVIGGFRTRYRALGEGDKAPRGSIDPFIGISFLLGPQVDASGQLPDKRTFANVQEFQSLLAAETNLLLTNLARQFAIYSTGRDVAFSDREAIARIVAQTEKEGGGVRTLIRKLTQSELFQSR
ncbi:DUF1592 domain-containing protein [Lignipirellula cremea]|uniref:Planctomycete cytochrome C n=1 Tax=Lignipirellula cremea TaxID=2528010 RepID=A0A518DNJ1_9BACT|nr:DUF1592 domain-containing protein [Lignipirellula cremea]QDU93405.1 hypothetical protein Pla8534_11850 [Lignipirellula cremea]